MNTLPQIEREINKQLDRFDKPNKKLNLLEALADQAVVLAYLNGIGFALSQKERMAVSQKTRERLLKATKEYRKNIKK